MLQKARDLAGRRFVRGLAISVTLHALVVALALTLAVPATRSTVKRGEPLFVELPELPEPPPRGNPAAKSLSAARPAPPAAKPAPPAQPSEPAEQPPAPPAPAVAATPPPVVASRPATPAPPDLPTTDQGSLTVPAPTPEPPAPESARPQPPAGGGEPAPAGPLVASVPPRPPTPPPVDIRSALGREGGAGSAHGTGRGGIEGEPVPLDSNDPRFDDFLDRVRRQIKANWGYPCIKLAASQCEYKSAQLVVEFGVLKAGRVQYVEILKSSGFQIYDEYAVNAIKLGSPFPPVPNALMVRMKPGSTGTAIVAVFTYTLDTTLTNILR